MNGLIKLEGLDFFAHHGYYEEEQKIGNKYTVDVILQVSFEASALNDELEGTVNYEEVYAIVQEVMAEPTKLLETIAHRINQKIKSTFEAVEWVKTSVSKHNPPIGGVARLATVEISSKEYEH